jgi:hypothetical protein
MIAEPSTDCEYNLNQVQVLTPTLDSMLSSFFRLLYTPYECLSSSRNHIKSISLSVANHLKQNLTVQSLCIESLADFLAAEL